MKDQRNSDDKEAVVARLSSSDGLEAVFNEKAYNSARIVQHDFIKGEEGIEGCGEMCSL